MFGFISLVFVRLCINMIILSSIISFVIVDLQDTYIEVGKGWKRKEQNCQETDEGEIWPISWLVQGHDGVRV